MINNSVFFYNSVLFLLLVQLLSISPDSRPAKVVSVPRFVWAFPLAFLSVWLMASCPIVLGSWDDRSAYASAVLFFQQYGYQTIKVASIGEWVFELYTYVVSLITDYQGWFYITAIVYICNYMLAARRLTMDYAYVLFFSIVCNFQFYDYGTNTVRAGFAASFVMLGLSFCNRFWVMLLCFLIALFSHNSMVIPIFALLIAYKIPKPKLFIWLWLLAIPLSLFAGSFFQQYLMGFADERRTTYFAADAMSRARFRWDFLVYSATPVLLGYYYIFKLNFKSHFYQWVYCAYLIANAVWILVIKAEYTDRFAYLSWFMFPILLLYPVLTKQLFYDVRVQRNHIAMTLACQYAFCYYMYLAYNGFKPF